MAELPEPGRPALDKLAATGAAPPVLAAFARRLAQLAEPGVGLLPGDELEAVGDVDDLAGLPQPDAEEAHAALAGLAVVRVNGGLGTSMGLQGPKSTIVAKDGRSFLDVIAQQVLAIRSRHDVRLPLVLMDTAATRGPSLEALRRWPALAADVPLDFLQSVEPKLRADDHGPVSWPADPALEWCPPGHGDLWVALAASGMLDALLAAGYERVWVANADNLGARPDPQIAAWARREQLPVVMEVVRGTAADRKGGHLARHRGRLVLRETAQVPDGDASFGDVDRWRSYNTNTLWIDLRRLAGLLEADPAGPVLPLIVNAKTVDPNDPGSPAVLQLETAMGAAIGAIDGAVAVEVPRARFAPVKTTADLLVLRSDAWVLAADGGLEPSFDGPQPLVTLDPGYFRALGDFEARFPAGPPSLRDCTSLQVRGDVSFGAGVRVVGDVRVDGPAAIPDGATLSGYS